MTKCMLIDATHPEETRAVVMDGDQLVDFDFETSTKKQLKGNIYLAKVTRVEPSLQAAFVEYGGNRHGFLAFSEIHPDYYQIPQADRATLEKFERETAAKAAATLDAAADAEAHAAENGEFSTETDEDEERSALLDEQARRRSRLLRSYKIQEVIKRRQIMLVQVVKEERGNKGAALTTYLSLAGRYCVLMPNTPRGGGISRKIQSVEDRRRLKSITQELEIPTGMGLIVRTAGQERSKAEIRRDYDYLLRLWNEIRETTLKSIAPKLIYEEGDLIKRALRDLYTRDIEEILVEGEEGYKDARRLMQMLMPSRARLVKLDKEAVPLFFRYGVENHLDAMHSPVVHLPSGGSIVIHTTEALTAIDVNSGRSTRERHIDETAVKTNLEAADEVARQMRLRDVAGLIVIDFIDMAEARHQRSVEKRIRDALKLDRARLQVGRISQFGLLELSRQRMRASLLELSTQSCPVCTGTGVIRSVEGCALQALRAIEGEGIRGEAAALQLILPVGVAVYLLNHKRETLSRLQERYAMQVQVDVDPGFHSGQLRVEMLERRERMIEPHLPEPQPPAPQPSEEPVQRRAPVERARAEPVAPEPVAAAPQPQAAPAPAGEETDENGRRKRRRRRRRRRGGEAPGAAMESAEPMSDFELAEAEEADADEALEGPAETADLAEPVPVADADDAALPEVEPELPLAAAEPEPQPEPQPEPELPLAAAEPEPAAEPAVVPEPEPVEAAAAEETPAPVKPKRVRRPSTRKPRKTAATAEPVEVAAEAVVETPLPVDEPASDPVEAQPEPSLPEPEPELQAQAEPASEPEPVAEVEASAEPEPATDDGAELAGEAMQGLPPAVEVPAEAEPEAVEAESAAPVEPEAVLIEAEPLGVEPAAEPEPMPAEAAFGNGQDHAEDLPEAPAAEPVENGDLAAASDEPAASEEEAPAEDAVPRTPRQGWWSRWAR